MEPTRAVILLGLLVGCAGADPAEPSDPIVPALAEPSGAFVEGEPTSNADAEFRATVQAYVEAKQLGELDADACAEFEQRFMAIVASGGPVGVLAEFNAASIIQECGDDERAMAMFRSLCDREVAVGCHDLGVLLFQHGREDEGLELFRRASELEQRAQGEGS